MPTLIKINVSRKLSKDFQSQGFGLEIQTELPSSAVSNPNEMAEASDELFRLAEDLLQEQINKAQREGESVTAAPQARRNNHAVSKELMPQGRFNGNGHSAGNGRPIRGTNNGAGNAQASGPRPITGAQIKAVERMAQKLDGNAEAICKEDFGKGLKSLSLQEASQLIDNLKAAIESAPAQGGQR